MILDLTTRALGGLSASCLLRLTTTLGSAPLSTCAATSKLTPFLSLIGGSSESLLPTFSNYLDEVCSKPVCSNDTIKTAVGSILESCGDVVSSFGVSNETIDSYIPYLPQVKNIVCLESNSTDSTANGSSVVSSPYCSVQTLSSLQQALGQNLTVNLIQQIVSGQTTLAKLLPSSGDNATNLTTTLCTPCAQSIYLELNELSNSSSTVGNASDTSGLMSQVKTYLGNLCGGNFTNATMLPESVQNGTDINSVTTAASSAGFPTLSLNAAGVFAVFGLVGMMI